jgi:hypothetical protein
MIIKKCVKKKTLRARNKVAHSRKKNNTASQNAKLTNIRLILNVAKTRQTYNE